MSELTAAQIEKAAEAYEATGRKYALRCENNREARMDALRAAAPFLQLPWDEPTEQEKAFAWNQSRGNLRPDEILASFILARNAELLPMSPDPRRAAIISVLNKYPDRAPEIADQILDELDRVAE